MLFALFLLIQSSLPGNLSKLVIIGVILFLIIGVSALVYFLRRLKSSEKQAEDEWAAPRSLFRHEPATAGQERVDTPDAASQTAEGGSPDAERWSDEEKLPKATATLVSPTSPAPRESSATRILSSEPHVEPSPAVSEAAPEPITPVVEELATPRAREPEEARADRGTELLVSPAQVPRAPVESAPFDEEVWAELHDTVTSEPPAHIEPTRPFGASPVEQTSAPPLEPDEVEPVARVEQRADRAPFESPAITPLAQREPFAPPTITPITPRQQSEMRAEQSTPPPSKYDLYGSSSPGSDNAPTTNLYSQPASREAQSQRAAALLDREREAEHHTRELATPVSVTSATPPAPGNDDWAAVSAGSGSAARERRTPTGAILGLPVTGGGGPLILGNPVKDRDDISALSNYGKPPAEKGGKSGTIALLLVILILGGSAAAYLLSPTVHAKVNGWLARARGEDPEAMLLTPDPKVMIFPSRVPETDKSTVKTGGSVENISKETLENLSIEISLERDNGASELRTVTITPSPLEPGGHGTYAFEYDGSKETGFARYTIKRALSNGNPLRFTAPGQK